MNQLVRDTQRWKNNINNSQSNSPSTTPSSSPSREFSSSSYVFGEPKMIGPYEFRNTIGEGSSGSVKLAFNNITGSLAAVKIVSKAIARKRRDARKEIKILENSDHCNIIHLECIQEDYQNIYIFTEYQENGDLYSYIDRNGPLDEFQAKTLAMQMINAVEYCQKELKIVHHDIKLENFVIDRDFQLKLIDFGFAVEIENDPSAGQKLITSFDSSPAYACIEILLRRPHDMKCDIYSLGVCFYLMLCGYFPFCDPERTTYDELCNNLQSNTVDFPSALSSASKDLIERMLLRKDTLSWEQIRNHPWFIA